MSRNANDPRTVYVIDAAADPGPLPEIVVRRFVENGCTVTGVVIDPADAQQMLYGTVTRPDGTLAGTYYPADAVRGDHWRIVAPDGTHYHAPNEYGAVEELTTTFRDRDADTANDATAHPTGAMATNAPASVAEAAEIGRFNGWAAAESAARYTDITAAMGEPPAIPPRYYAAPAIATAYADAFREGFAEFIEDQGKY